MFPRISATLLLVPCLFAAPEVNLRYVGEIGHLGVTQALGSTINLGLAEVRVGGSHVFAGKDSAGKSWRFTLPYRGDNSATRVFAGDLDKNGREDLLVINFLPGDNGCGTAAGDLTLLLMDSNRRPQAWQSSLRLARTTRDEDLPLVVADRNGDGLAEFAVITCQGETPALRAVYETRPEGVVPVAVRTWPNYGGDARKLYRNKSLWVPREDSTAPADEEPPATVIERVSTPQWGTFGSTEEVAVSGGAVLPAWPRLAVAVAGFRAIRPTGHDLTDLLDLMAQATPVRADGVRLLRTFPSDTSRAAPLTARLSRGTARERKVALVESEVPRTVRDASYFLVKGDDCFAFHVGSGDTVGVMHTGKCAAVEMLRAKGLNAPQIQVREAAMSQADPASREWSTYNADDGQEQRRLKMPGEGQLETVAPLGDFLFTQWRAGGRTWLTLHLEDGTPLTGRFDLPATDQLLYADEEQGLVMLRWAGNRPASWITVPVRVDWTRQ